MQKNLSRATLSTEGWEQRARRRDGENTSYSSL